MVFSAIPLTWSISIDSNYRDIIPICNLQHTMKMWTGLVLPTTITTFNKNIRHIKSLYFKCFQHFFKAALRKVLVVLSIIRHIWVITFVSSRNYSRMYGNLLMGPVQTLWLTLDRDTQVFCKINVQVNSINILKHFVYQIPVMIFCGESFLIVVDQ